MIKLTRAVAVLVVFALTAAAQSPAQNWNNVKALAAGTEVRVNAGSRTVTGRVQSATDDSVALNSASGQEMFSRTQITRVSVKKGEHRRRNTLIGLGAGAALGLIAGSITDSKCAGGSCFIGPNFGKAVLTPAGAVLGTGTGVAWPTGGWREVYKQ